MTDRRSGKAGAESLGGGASRRTLLLHLHAPGGEAVVEDLATGARLRLRSIQPPPARLEKLLDKEGEIALPFDVELTESEARVARLVADGLTNREIAEALSLAVRTVETHLTRIYRRTGLGSRRELARALGATRTVAARGRPVTLAELTQAVEDTLERLDSPPDARQRAREAVRSFRRAAQTRPELVSGGMAALLVQAICQALGLPPS